MERRMADELSGFRKRIDACDAQIIRLINDRLKICLEVGEYKSARGIAVKDETRESEVIAKRLDGNEGPCPPEVLRRIYRILIDTAVRLEEE